MSEQGPQPAQQQVLAELSRWLVAALRPEPGWQELHLQLRPLRDEVDIRLVEVREGRQQARLGTITAGEGPYDLVRRLQELSVRPGDGTWIEATVVLTQGDQVAASARFNRDREPRPWREGDTPLNATDLVHHLTRYPRRTEAVPGWMSERIAEAGLAVPAADDTAPPPAADPTSPAGDPADLPRPEALDITVDRDGPVLADGQRPGRRRLRLGGSLTLYDVLETVGVPLPFVDDRGTWIVRHGSSRDSGTILAVVEQGPGASSGQTPPVTIHLLSQAVPAQLIGASGRIELYYCSVPGELQVVLDSARLGEVAPPPTPATPPDHEHVRTAIAAYAEEQTPQRKLHVMRQVLGGRLVVDATGSQIPTPGTANPQLRLSTIVTGDGTRALAAFTNNDALVEFRKRGGTTGEVTGVAQSGPQLLELFRRTEELTWFVIDPAGPSCTFGRKEVDFALGAPTARGVKDLLAGTFTQQELLAALSEPELSLYIAQTTTGDRTGPVLLRDRTDGKPVLLAFTSTVEVAAYNPKFGARRLPVGAVLQLVVANRAKALLINPSGPRAVLPLGQVWHALGNPELPPAPPSQAAPDAPGDAPAGGPGPDAEPDLPEGDALGDDAPEGDVPGGDVPGGNAPEGEVPGGHAPDGSAPGDDAPEDPADR